MGYVIGNLWSGNYRVLRHKELLNLIFSTAPQFRGYALHNSFDFMRYLISALHEEFKLIISRDMETGKAKRPILNRLSDDWDIL
jgi:hypothetical protein